MTDSNISEVTTYLNLETIAFIINNFINFFTPSINFICYMFGIGMLIHMLLSILFLYLSIKSKKITITK